MYLRILRLESLSNTALMVLIIACGSCMDPLWLALIWRRSDELYNLFLLVLWHTQRALYKDNKFLSTTLRSSKTSSLWQYLFTKLLVTTCIAQLFHRGIYYVAYLKSSYKIDSYHPKMTFYITLKII